MLGQQLKHAILESMEVLEHWNLLKFLVLQNDTHSQFWFSLLSENQTVISTQLNLYLEDVTIEHITFFSSICKNNYK